ncbi:hypothetical protein [uncultured Serinicoccus sp.]|uniref:hypothetical protein n=1 Tax=uncultured Serinicoccus sp. TaxID=735514 RepID=UPI00262A5943|nr:hypothetical protein [uncultured Serinicoccus sp.]
MGALTSPRVPRRSVLLSGTGGLLLAGVAGCRPATTAPDDQAATTTGASAAPEPAPVMSALHVHSSFSEGAGSMHAQLEQAAALGVQALWWTDHDWRMNARGYLDRLSPGDLAGDRVAWEVDGSAAGPGGSHAVVQEASGRAGSTSPVLQLEARAEGRRRVEHRLQARSERSLYSTSLHGQRWTLAVHLEERVDRAFLAVDLLTSWRPALQQRSPGPYRLSYRFSDHREGIQVVDHVAEVYIRVPVGAWQEVVIDPARDLTVAWPEIDGRDASCTQLSVAALAWGSGAVRGAVGDMEIARTHVEGQEPAATQRDVMTAYAAQFPDVRQMQGVELSVTTPHICWYGSRIRLPDEDDGDPTTLVPEIRSTGGVAVYAHPFGVAGGTLPRADQESLVAARAADLVDTGAHGCTALEVGYRQRGGADLESHERLWDECSRRGLFLTGVGVSDNHSGMNWATQTNNFVTWLWSVTAEQDDLLAALLRGQAFFGDPTLFTGRLDIRCGDDCRMGQVAVAGKGSTRVRLVATDLPPQSRLELVRVDMDDSGRGSATETAVADQFVPEDLGAGEVEVDVSTGTDCFVRTRVRQASGEVVALSNPVWLLQRPRDYTVPSARLPGTTAEDRERPWW